MKKRWTAVLGTVLVVAFLASLPFTSASAAETKETMMNAFTGSFANNYTSISYGPMCTVDANGQISSTLAPTGTGAFIVAAISDVKTITKIEIQGTLPESGVKLQYRGEGRRSPANQAALREWDGIAGISDACPVNVTRSEAGGVITLTITNTVVSDSIMLQGNGLSITHIQFYTSDEAPTTTSSSSTTILDSTTASDSTTTVSSSTASTSRPTDATTSTTKSPAASTTAATTTGSGGGAGTTTGGQSGTDNPKTGIAVSVTALLIAAAGAIAIGVSRKKK